MPEISSPRPEEEKRTTTGRLSAKLAALDMGTDTTVGRVVDSLGNQAFGATMFVFAAPNLVPNPPGTSPFLGAPLLFLSFQLLLGRSTLWLPAWLRQRTLSQQFASSFVRRTVPWLLKLERLLRPRFGVMVETALATRLIGLASLPLAAILLLPLPFLHMLPGAAVACLAAGLAERDGVMVAIGHALALVTLCLAVALVSFAHAGVMSLIG